MDTPGSLTMGATPKGNLGDPSHRAKTALSEAEVWFVEDSRISGKLQSLLQIKRPMKVLNEHTSPAQVERYRDDLLAGLKAVVVTDGGAPGISDPGARLCDLCHEAEVAVDAIPGPSAVIDALMLSGFYAQRFAFLGFLPRKNGPMSEELAPFADSPYTLVLFESQHRLSVLLQRASEVLGSRRYAICREMTKIHQQIYRDTLPNMPTEASVPLKGEFTIVIEGRRKGFAEC